MPLNSTIKSVERRNSMENNFIPPINIEKFAAYLDGNLSVDEMQHVSAVLVADSKMQEIIELSDFVNGNLYNNNYDSTNLPNDIFSMNFEIPSIESDFHYLQEETLLDESLVSLCITLDPIAGIETDVNSDNGTKDHFLLKNSEEGDRSDQNELSINTEESDKHYGDSNELKKNNNDDINLHPTDYYGFWGDKSNVNSMETKVLQSGTILYGEFGENLSDPIFIRQPDDHSCALRSQQIVLRDFGIDIPFKELEKIALDNEVYSDEGTYTYDIGKVLEIAGVGMHQVAGSSMYDLTHELAQGHRVIVSVDADELWYNDSLIGKLKNWISDVLGHQGGNHALIVAGVEINPNNPEDVTVVLTDPGAGYLRIEYSIDQFMNAWKDSNCFMAATDNPAPYQYDAATGLEIPSNFVVQQHFNRFIAENSYQLSPDLINVPADYQPTFTGHIDMVGEIDYDAFNEHYESIVDLRIPPLEGTSNGMCLEENSQNFHNGKYLDKDSNNESSEYLDNISATDSSHNDISDDDDDDDFDLDSDDSYNEGSFEYDEDATKDSDDDFGDYDQ